MYAVSVRRLIAHSGSPYGPANTTAVQNRLHRRFCLLSAHSVARRFIPPKGEASSGRALAGSPLPSASICGPVSRRYHGSHTGDLHPIRSCPCRAYTTAFTQTRSPHGTSSIVHRPLPGRRIGGCAAGR